MEASQAMVIQWSSAAMIGLGLLNPSFNPSYQPHPVVRPRSCCSSPPLSTTKMRSLDNPSITRCYSDSSGPAVVSSEYEQSQEESTATTTSGSLPLRMQRTRRRYRKQYPGEKEGITEEMRFVAMKLRNVKDNEVSNKGEEEGENDKQDSITDEEGADEGVDNGGTWKPSMEGFVKYLVDSKLVFSTVERIVDESSDVSYAYFRKTGLERSESLSNDLECFSEQDVVIPEPSNPGVTYAKYLEELAEKSPPSFLCHFYNIYFTHVSGGQIIARKISNKLLEGRELEFYRWEENPEELMRRVREKLNMVGEHWPRDEKNKCLREVTKCFRFMGQIVRLIIL